MRLPSNPDSESLVVIPCDKQDFAKFMGDLLRSPKKISIFRHIIIDINREDIENIYFMLCQRLKEQHDSVPISFVASFGYEDRSSIKLSSIGEVREYGDVKKSMCSSIRLEWIFLVDIPGAETPQKQRVSLRITVPRNSEGAVSLFGIDDIDDLVGFPFWVVHDRRGEVFVEIEHTHRTLGFDLENLLKDQIDSLEIKDDFAKFFRQNGKILFIFLLTFSFFVALFFAMRALSVYAFKSYISMESSDQILLFFQSGVLLSTFSFSTFLVFISVVSIFYLSNRLTGIFARARPSFIRLSVYHEREAEQVLKKFYKRPQRLIFAVLKVISAGVATSIIFEVVKEYLL